MLENATCILPIESTVFSAKTVVCQTVKQQFLPSWFELCKLTEFRWFWTKFLVHFDLVESSEITWKSLEEMPFKRSGMRYAHTSGLSHCCYTTDGEWVFRSRTNASRRPQFDDQFPDVSLPRARMETFAFGMVSMMMIRTRVALENSFCIMLMQRNGFSPRRISTQFRRTLIQMEIVIGLSFGSQRQLLASRSTTRSVLIQCWSSSDSDWKLIHSQFIAACSEDTAIKVVPCDKSTEFFELKEHKGPVLRIDLSPTDLLASYSGDGTIKVWNLDEKKVVKTIGGLEKLTTYELATSYGEWIEDLRNVRGLRLDACFSPVTPVFEPKTGRFMAYNNKKEVLILDTKTWEVVKTMTDENVSWLSTLVIAFYSTPPFTSEKSQLQRMQLFALWEIPSSWYDRWSNIDLGSWTESPAEGSSERQRGTVHHSNRLESTE